MELKFGTAGIRGVMGPDPGQMNAETVAAVSRGLAGWLKSRAEASGRAAGDMLVVIARDSRNNSSEFALEAAKVLRECDIRALMFEDIMPVPVLSFAVRRLKADAGVVITASHNPKEYNGYKVYGPDGAQILQEDAEKIQEEISAAQDFSCAPHSQEENTGGCPRLRTEAADSRTSEASVANAASGEGGELPSGDFSPSYVPDEVYAAYMEAMSAVFPRSGSECGPEGRSPVRPLKVIYTPLNGSGLRPVSQALEACGFDVFTVPEQEQPDGDFPTCGQPNPELESAYGLALEYAREQKPDIIIATDPDCDRVGAMALAEDGSYRLLSGNDLGVLVLSYLCERESLAGKAFISSFVSTPLADRIAKSAGMEVIKTPVGFKHIAARMEELGEAFGYGFEESNGMLAGLYARDKDGVLGARLICEAADSCRRSGSSALKALERQNREFGPVVCRTVDVPVDPSRPRPETRTLDFEDGGRVVIRPSGTEPKVKYYFFAADENRLEDLRKSLGV